MPHSENYTVSPWVDLGSSLTAEQENEVAIYQSDLTESLAAELKDKFYVIKPKSLPMPSLNYRNMGNMLVEQHAKILGWKSNHAGDQEAIARYDIQLEEIESAIEELGLAETAD